LKEVQEGDPRYLAPEILSSNNNITCAADVFSLGMTILELAVDLELPNGGELWHILRKGQITRDQIPQTCTLSHELIGVIGRMIEPDHLKRASASELLNTSFIQNLLSSNEIDDDLKVIDEKYKNTVVASSSLIYNNEHSHITNNSEQLQINKNDNKSADNIEVKIISNSHQKDKMGIVNRFFDITLTVCWCLTVYPCKKIKMASNKVYQMLRYYLWYDTDQQSSEHDQINFDETTKRNQQTSTPNKKIPQIVLINDHDHDSLLQCNYTKLFIFFLLF
jgi:serine/threonine protein kinase